MSQPTHSLPILESDADRLKAILEQRPLYMTIETTNICNARCVFCAYPKMQRAKTVMTGELFSKIIRDYVDMGGGAVSLTPIVGDPLLDPHLLDRLHLLNTTREITDVGFITNGIAWGRYSERDQRTILESIDGLGLSIGGVDADSYRAMFAVDRFDKVCAAIDSLCDHKARHSLDFDLRVMFRVNRPIDELLCDPRMARFRRPEIDAISAINSFGNWGGMVGEADLPSGAYLVKLERSPQSFLTTKKNPCFVYYTSPEIAASGIVSACGCMNAEAEELVLGDVKTQHLRDIWTGAARRRLSASFGTCDLPRICQTCTYYSDGEQFIRNPALRHVQLGDNPWRVMQQHAPPPPGVLLARALAAAAAGGHDRVALYGAGSFARTAVADRDRPFSLHALTMIIDDNPALQGTQLRGIPIVSTSEALGRPPDCVILATDHFTAKLWQAAEPFRRAGIPVMPAVPSAQLTD